MFGHLAFGTSYLSRILLAYLSILAWGVTEGLVRANSRARGGPKESVISKDRWSFGALMVALVIALGAPYLFLARGLGPVLPLWVAVAGTVLTLIGIGVREWALFVLGRFFSPTVVIRADHRIVRDGPYRWIRHPSYTGLVLIVAGIGLILGAVFGVLLALGVASIGLGYRIHVEEQALVERFGEEYGRYRESTWTLLPGLY
ncbi:MAG: isoprenylcysteine carboxylmethyltransferase family protein [Thermoplasmata archaeon]|nr:isoprenylcysteine carboxylmethyltransferase family protein [Thermoplasmata archaeon]